MDAPSQSFPQELAAIPDGERIVQAFGWAPSSWALGFVLLASLTLFQPAKLGSTEVGLMLGSLGLATFLEIYEVRRRKRPKVLVRPGYGPHIGIYRDGRLQRSVEVAQSHVFIRHPSRTWGPLFMLSLSTILCLTFLFPSHIQLSIGDRLLAFFAAVFCASLAASVVKTRLRCEECLFPYPSTAGFEHILVPRQAIVRIFSLPG